MQPIGKGPRRKDTRRAMRAERETRQPPRRVRAVLVTSERDS